MNLVLAVTGATGAYAAKLLLEKSPWPVDLIASDWGKDVAAREIAGGFDALASAARRVYADRDLAAPIASGSVPTAGMAVLPCSANTLARIAAGLGDSLIARAAHCHLKEGRKLVLCVREAPWSLIDLQNAARASAAGAVIMPMSPPFYLWPGRDPKAVTMHDLLTAYVDRVLTVLGHVTGAVWEGTP